MGIAFEWPSMAMPLMPIEELQMAMNGHSMASNHHSCQLIAINGNIITMHGRLMAINNKCSILDRKRAQHTAKWKSMTVCWEVLGFPYLKIEKFVDLLNFHFMLLIDIKLISKVSEKCYRDLHCFPVHILHCSKLHNFNISNFQKKQKPNFSLFKLQILQFTSFKIQVCQTSKLHTFKVRKLKSWTS